MTTTAAIYCRISHDAEGDALGVARQAEDCRALAERNGFTVADVYADNDIGASASSRKKRRPEYDRMLADARAGKVGVIVAYSNSRLTRRLRELEDLIQLHDQHGTRILTVVSGEDNLGTADGRMVARIKASVDAGEAERTAERVTRKHLELAQAGKVVGGGNRPFGWEADQVTIRPREASLLREAAQDVLAGLPLRRVVTRWNDAGITTSTGKPWTNTQLLQVLRSPRLAGWRVHRTKNTKWTVVPPVAVGKDGQPVRGQWEPILDDATHRALVAVLTTPDIRSRIPRKGARNYTLSGLLRCGECSGPMYANKVGDTHYYRCDSGTHSNTASGRGLDAWVGEQVVLHSELLSAVETGIPTPAREQLAAKQSELADVNEMIDDIMAAFKARTISASVAFKNVEQLEVTRDALLRERDALEAEALASTPEAIDATAWAGMDTDQRRAACERSLSAVYVRTATRRGNQFDTSRIDPVWR
jgi:site-specific DNA recombinase